MVSSVSFLHFSRKSSSSRSFVETSTIICLTEADMEKKHRELLRRKRLALVEDLEPKQLLNNLFQEGTLNDNDVESIKVQNTRLAQAEKLLDTLPRRGPKAFDNFCRALKKTDGQGHLVEVLLGSETVTSGHSSVTTVSKSNLTTESNDGTVAFKDQEYTHSKTKTLEVKKTSQDTNQDDGLYPMTSRPHGWCLIVNNVDFVNLRRRGGSDRDAEKLKSLFSYLQYRVKIVRNLTAKDLKETLFQFSRSSDHKAADSMVLCMLSHGLEGQIYGVDGVLVSIPDLLALFNGYSARDLIGKPKLVFIQACRGSDFDRGIEMTDSGVEFSVTKTTAELLTEAFPTDVEERFVEATSLPAEADMLVAYSTVPGYVSWSNLEKGSWFIQALVEVFGADAAKEDVVSMIVKVNGKVAREFESNSRKKQMPAPVVMLTKKVYFHPGS